MVMVVPVAAQLGRSHYRPGDHAHPGRQCVGGQRLGGNTAPALSVGGTGCSRGRIAQPAGTPVAAGATARLATSPCVATGRSREECRWCDT